MSRRLTVLFVNIVCILPIRNLAIDSLSLKSPFDNLVLEGLKFIVEISDEKVFDTQEYRYCEKDIIENVLNVDKFQNTLNYCGKDLYDQGQENECLRNNKTTYFLFHYKLLLNDSYFKSNISDNEVIKFLNSPEIYTGFCMYKGCMSFLINHYFNSSTNVILREFLHKSAHIIDLNFSVENEFSNLIGGVKDESSILRTIFIVFTLFSLTLFGIMVIVSVLRFLYMMFSEDNKYSVENTEEEEEKEVFQLEQNKSISDISKDTSEEIKFIKPNQSSFLERLLHHFKVIDFFSNWSYLFGLKNRYYNDEGLEVVSFLRCIVMFFVIYFHICCSLLVIPPQDPYNISFYKSFKFFFVKLSTFSTICWIILDATIVSYNLMSNIKKKINSNNSSIPFSFFCAFALNSISKIFIILLIYLYLNVMGKYFSCLFSMGILFQHFYSKEIVNELVSFILQQDQIQFVSYLNVYMNEFYCFIIVLFVFYISFKLRSKIYDDIILLILFINCGVTYFEIESFSLEENTFLFVLGQNYTYRNIYLFINIYLMGIFVGLCYFYHNDMLSKSPLCSMEAELPFNFCFWIANNCDRMAYGYKCLCLAVFSALMLLLSFSCTIKVYLNKSLTFKTQLFDRLLDNYEKTIFAFVFCWLLLFLLIHPKDTSFKHMIHSNIFVPLSRITTVFYCTCKMIIYISITAFNFKINLSYYDFFFAAIGLFILNILVSMVITIIYEMPVRIIIKYIKKKWKTKDDLSSYSSKLK